MYVHHGGHFFFGWFVGVLFFLLLIALVVYVVMWLVRGRGVHSAAVSVGVRSDDPLSILRLRYARGEVSRDEFLRINDDLGGAPPANLQPPPS